MEKGRTVGLSSQSEFTHERHVQRAPRLLCLLIPLERGRAEGERVVQAEKHFTGREFASEIERENVSLLIETIGVERKEPVARRNS